MSNLSESEQDHVLDRYNELKEYLGDLYTRWKLVEQEVEYREHELLLILDKCGYKSYKVVMKSVTEIRNTLSMCEEDDVSI